MKKVKIMGYLKNIKKIKYDPELISFIQTAAGINEYDLNTKYDNNLSFYKNKMKHISTAQVPIDPERAARIERLRQAIRNMSGILGKIVIGLIIHLFVRHKIKNFTLQFIKESEKNKQLVRFIEKEIEKVYAKHPEYEICTLEQFKKTSMFNYIASEWRDKDTRQVSLHIRKHAVEIATEVILTEAIPIPGSTALIYPTIAMLYYMGLDFGTSIMEVIVNFNSYCLSIGINLRPIGFVLNNLVLYSFKDKTKLVGTDLTDPPEDLYKVTVAEAKEFVKKYENEEKLKQDIDLIYSKMGM